MQLLKTKVHQEESSCKLGIRLRANPRNSRPLTKICVIVVVPPDLNGYSVQMTRKGGKWDDMKRTLTWIFDGLAPGESIDIQAVFANVQDGQAIERRFPIMLQCHGDELFSKVQVHAYKILEASRPLRVDLTPRATIIFRKV